MTLMTYSIRLLTNLTGDDHLQKNVTAKQTSYQLHCCYTAITKLKHLEEHSLQKHVSENTLELVRIINKPFLKNVCSTVRKKRKKEKKTLP